MTLSRKLHDVTAGDEFSSMVLNVPECVRAHLEKMLLKQAIKEAKLTYGDRVWMVSVSLKTEARVEVITSSGDYSLAIEIDEDQD